jgi:hypothetical protein
MTPSQRKFYRTVYTIEVLSEEIIPENASLNDVIEESTIGGYSMIVEKPTFAEVNGPTMAKLLLAQASDPEFFQLNQYGEDSNG